MPDRKTAESERLEALLEQVTDPEIPVVSIRDLGILRNISLDGGQVTVTDYDDLLGLPGDEHDQGGYQANPVRCRLPGRPGETKPVTSMDY